MKLKHKSDSVGRRAAWKAVKPIWKLGRWLNRKGSRLARDLVRKPKHKLRRKLKRFDKRREKAFIAEIAQAYSSSPSFFDAIRFSIIMPVYNREDTLERAIRSILDQSHWNFELIVVDDGSFDNSYALAGGFKDERLRLIRSEHRGVGAARNTGLREATGEIVAYLDSDNAWTPDFLRRMAVFMSSRDLSCGYAAVEMRNESGAVSGYRGLDSIGMPV